MAPLQRVQNAAARLVFELGARDHVTAALATSPLAHQVQTVLRHTFCFYGKYPVYITNTV